MAWNSAETSNKSNKKFYSKAFVLFCISKLYLKKFKQFSLGDLLILIYFYCKFQAHTNFPKDFFKIKKKFSKN